MRKIKQVCWFKQGISVRKRFGVLILGVNNCCQPSTRGVKVQERTRGDTSDCLGSASNTRVRQRITWLWIHVVPLPGCPQAGSRMHSRSMSMAVLSSLLSSKSLSHICIRGTTSYTTCDANLRRRRRTILPRSVATADSDHVVGSLVLLRGSCS